MRISLWHVGRARGRGPLAEAADDYAGRLTRYATFTQKAVRPAPPSMPAPEAQRVEGERILADLPDNAILVLLDERGKPVRSEVLAERIDTWRHAGARPVVFCVGGAEGHGDALRDRADWLWSLSPLVFPHELARLIAIEQLYRAFTILAGEPYHRG